MKKSKILAVFCIILSVLFLVGCSNGPVKTVENEISSIGTVSENSINAIETARADYERLTDEEKEKVKNYQSLLDAEYDYDKLIAQKIDDMIDDIGEIDDSVPSKVEEIKQKYNSLTKEQQRLVNKFDKLDSILEKYSEYQVDKVVELIDAIKAKDKIEEADFVEIDGAYAALSGEQKDKLEEKLGQTYNEAMQAVQVMRCEYYINQIDYIEGTPSKQELQKILLAAEIYLGISDSARQSISNVKLYNNAIKEFSKYKKNRAKTDKLYARRQYIGQCEEIGVTDILSYSESYKGKFVSMKIVIGKETSGITHAYDCLESGTENLVELRDKREVREPVIGEGSELTIYGEITNYKTVKVKEENSGLFNTNLFAKVSEKIDVPIIEFVYTDIDNLGIIKSGNPNDLDVNEDPEFEDMINKIDEYIE